MADNQGGRDKRTPCKYGNLCYQKNKSHHEKYKHPSDRPTAKEKSKSPERPSKKPRLNTARNSIKNKELEIEEDKTADSEVVMNESDLNIVKDIFAENNDVNDKVQSLNSKKIQLRSDCKEVIEQLFLVRMPDDFFSFWEMCESVSKSNPASALNPIKLKLVGPFDVLAGKVNDVYERDISKFLKHWRFYYDPPEFQTVIVSADKQNFHMGYYRDDPKDLPVFVASNVLNSKNPEKNGELKIMGQNLFAALNTYLEELNTDPFSRMKIPKYQKILTNWVKEKGFSLEKTSKTMEARSRKVVAKTFHGAGIVVPVDKKNDVGYRELAEPNSMIKRILKGIVESKSEQERKKFWEQLHPVITFANIANDECDFGTSLELGLDLFTYGSPLLHRCAMQLLTTAYNLLGRSEFAKIIEVHLEDRKPGCDLSILEKPAKMDFEHSFQE